MHAVLSIRTLDNKEVHAYTMGTDRQYVENIYCELYMVNDHIPANWPYYLCLMDYKDNEWHEIVAVSKNIPEDRIKAIRNHFLQSIGTPTAIP